MSRVAFIIGNGFDLSLGLKTSYRDFYEYVRSRKLHPENRIYKAITESPKTWADFELALGQYTNYIDKLPEKDRKKESVEFHEELEVLREDLAKYLHKQEKTVENIPDKPIFTARSYFEELPAGQAGRIQSLVSERPIDIQFITLNYTEALEKILSENRGLLSPQGVRLNSPHYIHGTLQENLTLGVSDESQLSPSMSGAEKDDLIKPSLIYSMNDGRIETLQQIIGNSSIVVLFGASIAETDKYIWEFVNQWLEGHSQRYIIIHKHDDSYLDSMRLSSRRQKQFTSNVQDKILRYSGLDGDGIAALKNRIFVIHNTKKLFTIDK